MTGIHQALAAGGRARTLDAIIDDLALTSNLNLVLDAADIASYDGSSQTWTDVSGSGNHFFRGDNVSANATDPTFVGTAGAIEAGTYFSFDSGDYFTESTAQTFNDNWHKDNGAFTFIFAFYLATSTGNRCLFGNEAISSNGNGIIIYINSAEQLALEHSTTGIGGTQTITSTAAFNIGAWNFAAISFDEATTTTRLHINSTVESPATTTSTNSGTPNDSVHLGADGVGGSPLGNGERLAATAAWSTALSQANVEAIMAGLNRRGFEF